MVDCDEREGRMNALMGLALTAFVERRYERARRLFEAARARADGTAGETSIWPDHVYHVLAGIVEEALAGDPKVDAQPIEAALERVGALRANLPAPESHRDHATRRTVERVGFELARLAGRSDLMRRFGPPMTAAEAAWALQADPDFHADNSDEDANALDDAAQDTADGASSVTTDHLVAAAQRSGPTLHFSYPPYVFASLDQQARVRFSSPRLFQAFDARLAHTGRQTTESTSFTVRPVATTSDTADRIVDAIRGQRPTVRFEFASHDDGAVQVASFREVMVGRTFDGIELILDYGSKAFKTEQLPEEVWRALGSSSPVTVTIVL